MFSPSIMGKQVVLVPSCQLFFFIFINRLDENKNKKKLYFNPQLYVKIILYDTI